MFITTNTEHYFAPCGTLLKRRCQSRAHKFLIGILLGAGKKEWQLLCVLLNKCSGVASAEHASTMGLGNLEILSCGGMLITELEVKVS